MIGLGSAPLALAPKNLPRVLRFAAPGGFDRLIGLRVASFDMSRNAERGSPRPASLLLRMCAPPLNRQ